MLKKRILFVMPFLFVAVSVSFISAVRLEAAVELARDGETRAVIVHNGHTSRSSTRYSYANIDFLDELQDYFKRITGAELEAVETLEAAGERPAIVFELVEGLTQAGEGDTGRQAYHILSENNRIYLRAQNDLALSHAVFGLLEDHMGCRFYRPDFEIIPDSPTLVMEDIDDFQEPSFANRGLLYALHRGSLIVNNRGIGLRAFPPSGDMRMHHNLYGVIPPDELFEDYPDIYAMRPDGERRPDNWNMSLCGTSEELPRLLAERIDDAVRIGGIHSLGQGDGFAPCHCKDCRAVAYQEESEAAPYICL